MKTTLPERSLVIKEKLDKITGEILAIAKDKVAMIILFGSYARGDWVYDEYKEGDTTYSYQSSLDILLVFKKSRHKGRISSWAAQDIQRRLKRKKLIASSVLKDPVTLESVREFIKEPRAILVAEPIATVNEQLKQGQPFFQDIRKEGIMLYDSGEFGLVEPQPLPWKERRKIAKADYDHWFDTGRNFLINAKNALERGGLNNCAFELHQAVESFYNTVLLVFSGYKPRLYNIVELGSTAAVYSIELLAIFPSALPEDFKALGLLKNAYVDARHNKDYSITKDQLMYLIERVEKLQQLTKEMCLEYIDKDRDAAE